MQTALSVVHLIALLAMSYLTAVFLMLAVLSLVYVVTGRPHNTPDIVRWARKKTVPW